MDAVNRAAASINDGIAYLKNNAWPIALLLIVWFYLRPRVMSAMEDVKARRSPQQVDDYDRDLRRVRELQQKQAEQDAKRKAQELKEKKAAQILQEKKKTTKPTQKSGTAASSLSLNNFSTPSYRPQRRTVRKG